MIPKDVFANYASVGFNTFQFNERMHCVQQQIRAQASEEEEVWKLNRISDVSSGIFWRNLLDLHLWALGCGNSTEVDNEDPKTLLENVCISINLPRKHHPTKYTQAV